MRILHVVPTYLPATRYGGPIYSVHGLCSALARLGHEVHVFTTSVDGSADSDVPHGRPVDLDGVRIWYFRSRVGRRLYFAPAMARALRAEIRRFDIVHLHSVFLWPTAIAARIAERARVPYVVSPRGMLVRELIAKRSALVKVAWLAMVERRTLAVAAGVHLTSRRELEDARALPLPLPAPFVVPNGVELPRPGSLSRASTRVRRLCDGPRYGLYLGRIHWKKGLDRAVRAIAGTGVRLVLCGNDEENYRVRLERDIAAAGSSAQVHFEQPVAGDDKWALLAAAQFVVLPSLNENFGNVVVEAMAVGTPVVTNDRVGASDLVRDAGAGIVCDSGEHALQRSMLRLWDDQALAEALGRAGRAFVEQHLAWERVAERMSSHYIEATRG